MSTLLILLSPYATIGNATQPLRWSDYKAPQPGRVVHPATETDVSQTVKWAVQYNVPFLVQNGGNGWEKTFTLDKDGIIIQLDRLRSVTFDEDGSSITIGGGALISDVVAAAAVKGSLVLTGTCNSVGALGAILGGGFSNLTGEYGLGVDDVLSFNVVKPDGQAVTITVATNTGLDESDLWWAMRGAGPNFGIVTSAVLRAHPVQEAKLNAWTGPLTFRPDQLEAIISTLNNLPLTPEMALSLNLVNLGAPTILTTVFYHGSVEAGRLAFKPLFDIGPVTDRTTVAPYTAWNAGSDIACIKGGRRPTWGVGLATLDSGARRKAYNVWAELIQQPGSQKSSVLLNILPAAKARSLSDSSSAYPFRSSVNFHVTLTASYTDPAFDEIALSYGQRARALWQATDGLANHSTYINNAFGDESLETIYGKSLERLRRIKLHIDPHRRFNQWFPIF